MEVPDNGIDWGGLLYDLIVVGSGYLATFITVVLFLGWLAYLLKAPD